MVGGKGAYRMVGGAAHFIKVRDKKVSAFTEVQVSAAHFMKVRITLE